MAPAGSIGFRNYLDIFRAPQATRMIAAMFLGRLPNGMFPLGIVFVVQRSSSYTAAGATLAALMLGTTCSAPFRGRAVDRWGQSRILIALVLTQSVAMAGFLLTVRTGHHIVTLAVLGAAIGGTASTLGGSMRRTWPVLLSSQNQLQPAYALQALLEDLISTIGPLLSSLLLTIAPPTFLLVVAESAAVVGTMLFATAAVSRSVRGRPARRTHFLGVLSDPGMRTLAMSFLAANAVVGMLYVAVPAFTQARNSGSAAGTLLAVMAASSMLSCLGYGSRSWKSSVARRYVRLAGLFMLVAAPLALAGTTVQLGSMLCLVSIAYGPRVTLAYLLIDDLAPHDSLAEAYTWLVSANAGGIALGSAIAGPVVQHVGAAWILASAGACAVVSYAIATLRSATLDPPNDAHNNK